MNIVLFILDTLRADHLSCYGYPRETSPHLDALAAEGVRFDNAITNTAHTGPTFATFYTGLHPFRHGVIMTAWGHPNDPETHLNDETPTLAEQMRRAGYTTVAFDNLLIWPSHPVWVARGFDYYVNTVDPSTPDGVANVLAERINERLIPLVDSLERSQPFFMVVHYWDVHRGYNQPEPYRTWHNNSPAPEERTTEDGRVYRPTWGWKERLTERAVRGGIDLYDGEITYVDKEVARVLDALRNRGLYDDTLVVVTADHGEDMEEHNSPFEHREPYEATIRVPLIVKPAAGGPGRAGQVVSPQVGHVDLMPSLLDLAGAEAPQIQDGASWRGLLDAPDGVHHESLFVLGATYRQSGHWRAPELAVRTQTRKYIRRLDTWAEPDMTPSDTLVLTKPPWTGTPATDKADYTPADLIDYFNSLPREELYDLENDPNETTNLIDARPEEAAALRAEWRRHALTNPKFL